MASGIPSPHHAEVGRLLARCARSCLLARGVGPDWRLTSSSLCRVAFLETDSSAEETIGLMAVPEGVVPTTADVIRYRKKFLWIKAVEPVPFALGIETVLFEVRTVS